MKRQGPFPKILVCFALSKNNTTIKKRRNVTRASASAYPLPKTPCLVVLNVSAIPGSCKTLRFTNCFNTLLPASCIARLFIGMTSPYVVSRPSLSHTGL